MDGYVHPLVAKCMVGFVKCSSMHMRILKYFKRELLQLQSRLMALENKHYYNQLLANSMKCEGRSIPSGYTDWDKKVNGILEKGEEICRASRRSGVCDVKLRFKLLRSCKNMMDVLNDVPELELYSCKNSLEIVDQYYTELRERDSFLGRLFEVLMDDEQNSIVGLHGVIGNCERVALHISERAKEEKLFDEVVIVNVVSTYPNIYKIHCDLERKLGLEFKEANNMKERGEIIDKVFVDRRVLVILYNVKEKFELCDIEILGKYEKNLGSRVVVISPYESVYMEMGVSRLFRVPNLRDNGWDNFKTSAGNWIKKADRECIANEFVNRYCGGFSDAEDVNIRILADEMKTWITKIEKSSGIFTEEEKEQHLTRIDLFTPSIGDHICFPGLC